MHVFVSEILCLNSYQGAVGQISPAASTAGAESMIITSNATMYLENSLRMDTLTAVFESRG